MDWPLIPSRLPSLSNTPFKSPSAQNSWWIHIGILNEYICREIITTMKAKHILTQNLSYSELAAWTRALLRVNPFVTTSSTRTTRPRVTSTLYTHTFINKCATRILHVYAFHVYTLLCIHTHLHTIASMCKYALMHITLSHHHHCVSPLLTPKAKNRFSNWPPGPLQVLWDV